MSIENTNNNVTEDLDLFSAELFGQKQPEPTPEESTSDDDQAELEDVVETSADEDQQSEDDTLDTEDETNESEADTKPKKKNRFQERIDEVVGKQRETERQLNEARLELERLKNQSEKTPTDTPKTNVVEDTGPQPDAKNEDGSDKYPLGEFDPQYIRDLAKHTIAEERKAYEAEKAAEAQRTQTQKEQEVLAESWNTKLAPALERYPDFQEKGQAFVEAVNQKVDPTYAEYLTTIIMNMEYGPDVFYHLANNPEEAMSIIASGPHKAPTALGRLDAKFAFAAEEKQIARPKVSQAPEPPSHRTKGNSAAVADIPADTDDLEKFEKVFFPKKK